MYFFFMKSCTGYWCFFACVTVRECVCVCVCEREREDLSDIIFLETYSVLASMLVVQKLKTVW
jgi:hypothetical protein